MSVYTEALENLLVSWQSLSQSSSSSLCWQALGLRNDSPALRYLWAALFLWVPSPALQDDQLHRGAQLCWVNGRFFTVAIKRIGKGKKSALKPLGSRALSSREEMSQGCYLKPPARNGYPQLISSKMLLYALDLTGLSVDTPGTLPRWGVHFLEVARAGALVLTILKC